MSGRNGRRIGLAAGLCLAVTRLAFAEPIPRGERALLRWLTAGTYRDTYTPEPEVHVSAGPHGTYVRTWYSPELVAALRGGVAPFPRGVAVVKELFGSDTASVDGYSVMIKVRRKSGQRGQGWLWYETLDGRQRLAFGRGVRLCAGCHAAGTDFLRSTFRPE